MTTHSRAEAMRGAFCSSGPRRTTFGYSNQQNHRRDRPYSYGSRIPKTTPRHRTSATHPKGPPPLPTHSTSRVSTVPKNNRLDFLDKPSNKPLAKKGFVAMPSESMWEKGFRPAWMLSESRDPPEKYIDAQKMYKTYLETGEVIYPKKSTKGDTAKATATQYMHAYSNSKKMKKSK
jgi:hypothetical protein